MAQIVPHSICFDSPAWISISFTDCELSLSVLNKQFLGECSVMWTAITKQVLSPALKLKRIKNCCPKVIWLSKHLASSAHPLEWLWICWFCCFVLHLHLLFKLIKYLYTSDLPVGSCDKPKSPEKSQLQPQGPSATGGQPFNALRGSLGLWWCETRWERQKKSYIDKHQPQ